MSYLEDPRVFYAIERTLLAWIRTEIAVLALAFLVKKYGFESGELAEPYLHNALYILCGMIVLMSILSLWQCSISLSKLGEKELPSASSKRMVIATGLVGVLLSLIMCAVVILI